MSNLTKRIITALVLVGIALGTAYLGLEYFIYLTHFFVLLLQIELARMFFKDNNRILRWPFLVATFTSTLMYNYLPFYFTPFLFLLIPTMLSLLLVGLSDRSNSEILKISGLFSLGFVYVGLLPALTTKILMIQDGPYWMLVCLAVVFSGDVGAYFVGSRFGKKKILPQVSPNKSWEGAIGGLICSTIVSVIAGQYFIPETSIIALLLSGCLASLLAQSGDFFESLIKRIAGQKDSSSFLPGHGGFLDRFDGLIFAIPVYYYLSLY